MCELFHTSLVEPSLMISSPRTLVFGGKWEGIKKTRYAVVLSMVAGVALGGVAMQGVAPGRGH